MRPVKIIAFTLIVLIAVFALMLAANFLLLELSLVLLTHVGIDLSDTVGIWGGTILLLAILYVMPKHWITWNRRFECHGSTVIDAPLDQVWDWLHIHERDDYFASATKCIRKAPGTEDEFLMLSGDGPIGDKTPDHVHIRMIDEVPKEYIAYQVLNVEQLPLFGKDHMMTEILLKQQQDGVKVTYIENLARLTIRAFFALLFLNPARDTVTLLKAQIEGTEKPSRLKKWIKCLGPEGEPSQNTNKTIRPERTTAVVFTMGLAAAVSFVVLKIAEVG